MRAPAASLLLFSSLPCSLFAAGTPVETNVPVISFLQVVFALAVVLAAIVAFAWVLRRMTPGAIGGRGWLRVVGGAMVGPRERVVLIEIGDTWLLLGVAASNVSLLHTLPKPTQSIEPAHQGASPGFSGALLQALANRRRKS